MKTKIKIFIIHVFGIFLLFFLAFNMKKNQIISNSEYSYINFEEFCRYFSKYDIFLNNDCEIIVINIWEPWCKPCMNEIPLLNDIKSTFNGPDIEFYALARSSEEECKRGIEKKHIDFHYRQIYKADSLIEFLSMSNMDEKRSDLIPQHFVVLRDNKVQNFIGAKYENILSMKELIREAL